MPAWDNVSLAPPVTSRDYNQGFQNFLQLGNQIAAIPQSYWAGQNQAYQQNLRDLFKDNVPSDPNELARRSIQAGGAPYATQLAPFMWQTGLAREGMNILAGRQLTGGTSGQGAGGTGSDHLGGGTMRGSAVDQSTVGPGASAGDVSYGEGNKGGDVNGGPGPGEGSGANTIASMAAPYRLPPIEIAKISRALGIPKDQPIGDPSVRDKVEQALIDANQPRLAQAQPREPVSEPGMAPSEGGGGGYTVASDPSSVAQTMIPQGRTPQQDIQFHLGEAKKFDAVAASMPPQMQKPYLDAAAGEREQAKQLRESLGKAAQSQYEDQNKYYRDQYKTYNSQGMVADDLVPKVTEAKSLMNRPDIASGAPFPELVNRFKAVAANLGITNPNAAMPPELFKKFVSDILTQQIRGLAQSGVGRVLMSEVQNLRDGVATLQNTPASNRAQLEILRRTLEKQQVLADMARRYKGGNLDSGFDIQASNYLRSHPIFSPDEIAHPEILGAPTMRAGIDKRGDEKAIWGLKRGDPYYTPPTQKNPKGILMQAE